MKPAILALLVLTFVLQGCASSSLFEETFDRRAEWISIRHVGMQDRPVWPILIVRADER